MPVQPTEVARNQWGAIVHHPDGTRSVSKWFPRTHHDR
jgi:hypothetical protein